MKQFSDLLGKTLTNVENRQDEAIVFTLDSGEQYQLHHYQDCCEHVRVEDICGELSDLIGSPITLASEASTGEREYGYDGGTWTFYLLATVKGYVTIRWLGESNGYYSESVDFGPCQ